MTTSTATSTVNPTAGSADAPPADDLTHLAGEPADVALPRLLDAHGGRIYRLGLRFCGSPEEAEDLAQETFLQAYRKWHQFHGDANPATWLYTIAARACQRRRRLRAGEPKHLDSLDQLAAASEGPVADLPTDGGDPLSDQLRREAREAVERGIAELPHHYRMALVLKDIVELPVADVAGILGLKVATVKTRVHRARLHLRRILTESLPGRDAPPPHYSQRVCLDLLQAKQEALDRGVPFRVPQQEVCERCEALFTTLDLARDSCAAIGRGELPPRLRERLLEELRER